MARSDTGSSRRSAMTALTAGLKCAPLRGAKTSMRTYSANTVASVLASKAMATLPPARRSAMMPEPTTAHSKPAVPSSSASALRHRVMACRPVREPAPDGVKRLPEGFQLLLGSARSLRRVRVSPMRGRRVAGPVRADLAGGVVAHRDDQVHVWRLCLGELVPALA